MNNDHLADLLSSPQPARPRKRGKRRRSKVLTIHQPNGSPNPNSLWAWSIRLVVLAILVSPFIYLSYPGGFAGLLTDIMSLTGGK